MILECKKVKFVGSVFGHGTSFAGATYDPNGLAPTLNTMQGGGRQPHIVDIKKLRERSTEMAAIPEEFKDWVYEINGELYLIRIRKLTPRECWRLMGFTDEDFNKASQVVSNTQLYKQAGNSIVKPVLESLFGQLMTTDKKALLRMKSLALLG